MKTDKKVEQLFSLMENAKDVDNYQKKKCPQMDIMTNTNFAFKLKMKIFCFATDSMKNVYMDNLEPILVQN